MSLAADLGRRHASELRGMDGTLPELFTRAAGALEEPLGDAGLQEWARLGLDLARRSRRSPDVALAYFRVSPAVGVLEADAVARWAEAAARLADAAPQVAAAFLEATPAALAHLEPAGLERWARQGQRLCRRSWKSSRLAARFFQTGPELLAVLSLPELDRLVDVLGGLAQRSDDVASACLREAPSRLARLAESDREPFLAFAQVVCSTSWADTYHCFERGPALIEAVHPAQRSGLLKLASTATLDAGSEGFALFAAAAEALATLDAEAQAEVVDLAWQVARHAARAAMESVASAPQVRRRLPAPRARRWAEAGLELLLEGQPTERVESYFRCESALAEEMLAELAQRVELASVGAVLRLYAKALSGEQLLVQSSEALAGRNIGWARASASTTDGASIFLPPSVDAFGDRHANFQVYKVYTTHQAARLALGSFRYCFGVDGEHLPSTVLERERARPDRAADGDGSIPAAIPAMQRLLDLFDDRGLASELFGLAEATRIDAWVSREYPGLRRWLRRLQDLEAERRADVRRMALRQAFVESLVRASLGRSDIIRWPRGLAARLERAVATLRVVERTGATVQDTAEVAAALYDLAIALPNLPPERLPADWSGLDEDAVSRAAAGVGAGLPVEEVLPEGPEVPYESPERLEYRGDFKPELVQLLDRLTGEEGTGESGPPLTREQILELLEHSTEVEGVDEGDDASGDLDVLLSNIERDVSDRADEEDDGEPGAADEEDEGIEWFRYDEWDFRAHDYRPGWCRVGERTAAEGEADFYGETLSRYHGLVLETRRQFERLRPESFRLLKRLEDGDEIDLDRAIEFQADKAAGAGPLARFYRRRNKVKRDVAVAFLLDMSGSTSEAISPQAGRPLPPGARTAPLSQAGPGGSEKRIIDVERESTVLVVEALEAIGDAYGIYGFSGHGRENVEFHVIKDLDERFDEPVCRRIGKIEPIRSTRMGPAIRHTITKLSAHEAKAKILILISDGRPQDEEYGQDGWEKEYAVHDTRQALLEAKRRRITPFLITVDSAGHDYLRHMCDDMGYEVVADIESLPRRLPKLYRHLAAE